MKDFFISKVLFKKADFTHHKSIVDFQIQMAKETENIDLNKKTLEQGVLFLLQTPSKGYYLIAEYNKKDIACMLVLSEWSDWRNAEVLWIHSVYIEPAFRRKGVFRLMFSQIKKEVLSSSMYAGIRLFVDKRNKNAIFTYKALSMTNEHYDLFEWQK